MFSKKHHEVVYVAGIFRIGENGRLYCLSKESILGLQIKYLLLPEERWNHFVREKGLDPDMLSWRCFRELEHVFFAFIESLRKDQQMAIDDLFALLH